MINTTLFKFARTGAAYRRLLRDLNKFNERAANDRYAPTALAKLDLAAELCKAAGQVDIANRLREQVQAVEMEAIHAVEFSKRGKRRAAAAIGANAGVVNRVKQLVEAAPPKNSKRGRPAKAPNPDQLIGSAHE